MFGFITRQAMSVSARRRPGMFVDAIEDAARTHGSAHPILGVTIVTAGNRVGAEMPTARSARPDRD